MSGDSGDVKHREREDRVDKGLLLEEGRKSEKEAIRQL